MIPIIDSLSDPNLSPPAGFSRGLEPRDFDRYPFGGLAAPFDLSDIHRDEWADRIREREFAEATLTDVMTAAKIKCKSQENTNYCWAFGVTTAVEIMRASQGLPTVSLSPASMAAPIKNYRNQGGWGLEAIEYNEQNGIYPSALWPDTSRDSDHKTPEGDVIAKDYQVTEWYDLESNNFDQLATALLLGFPCALGLDWWRHLICAVDLVMIDSRKFGVRIRNSWGSAWGEDGYGILTERKSIGDAVAPRVVDHTV